MNPPFAQLTMHRPVMDVKRPVSRMSPRQVQPAGNLPPRPLAVPVSQPVSAVPVRVLLAPAAPGSTGTSIVGSIPLQAPSQLNPAHEDNELDKIMRDVGHELKQADRPHTKKHFSLLGHKNDKPAAPKLAQMVDIKPAAQRATLARKPAQSAASAVITQAKERHDKVSTAPVGVIFATLIITSFLIAAAVYSYK